MAGLALLVKGQTFLKTMAPLIIFASKHDIAHVHVFVYSQRVGKTYDNVNPATIDLIASHSSDKLKIHWVDGEDVAARVMSDMGIKNFVAQDAQYHYASLCRKFKSFSISQYTDTLHYAKTNVKDALLPSMTYFPTKTLHEKAQELIGAMWPGVSLGSPLQDHVLWIDKSFRFNDGSVLFLTPPENFLTGKTLDELDKLSDHCISKGAMFYVKDRYKFPMSDRKNMTRISNAEDGFPYTSLQLLQYSDIHISSYSTAMFEAQFLGKPALNIELFTDHGFGNSMVKSYELDVYNSDNRATVSEGFVESYERLIKDQRAPLREISFASNVSTDIIAHIAERLD